MARYRLLIGLICLLSLGVNPKADAQNACICGQVPLYPAPGGVWAWWSFHYTPPTCDAHVLTSVVEYTPLGPFPEVFCADPNNPCHGCTAAPGSGQLALTSQTEPSLSGSQHPLPAPPASDCDLGSHADFDRDVVEQQWIRFDSASGPNRWAKIFKLEDRYHLPGRRPVVYRYGFEVEPPRPRPSSFITMPGDAMDQRRLNFHHGGGSGVSREFCIVRESDTSAAILLRMKH